MQTQRRITKALLSVSDKSGLVEFARTLAKLNIEILATGGTAKLLQEADIPTTELSDYTGFPEIMAGRVKTLHPKIAGGLLGRRGQDDEIMAAHNIDPIDLVVVNLYPFAETIENQHTSLEQAIEQIDIGGPTMLRAAAKNSQDVTAVVDPADYALVLNEIQHHQGISLDTRRRLAQKVFAHTATYDAKIAQYLAQQTEKTNFPEVYAPTFVRQDILRYGENPHQAAALYRTPHAIPGSLTAATLLQGKPLSYNNIIDADCALQLAQDLSASTAACVIVKHATPCGVAVNTTCLTAYEKAYACDPQSAFGGIIAFNQLVDKNTSKKIISQQFVEVLLAPAFSKEALTELAQKRNLRVIAYGENSKVKQAPLALHSISGGLLLQEKDTQLINTDTLTTVTTRRPTAAEISDLHFAWHVVKYIKSNAIVFTKDGATLGIGTGQTSRIFAAQIAAKRAHTEKLDLKHAVLASDAFFPFADSIEFAAQLGLSAIIQPGGSVRDNEVIAAANQHNIAMVFTGIRHFRH